MGRLGVHVQIIDQQLTLMDRKLMSIHDLVYAGNQYDWGSTGTGSRNDLGHAGLK